MTILSGVFQSEVVVYGEILAGVLGWRSTPWNLRRRDSPIEYLDTITKVGPGLAAALP
jgi:hypothetical protein